MKSENNTYNIGGLVEGGHFTGCVLIEGVKYGIVVAPKETGESRGKWNNEREKIPAIHLADGMLNTQAMNEAGSPIAQWALALDINDYQDWYIPSRDELEIIYRNLKPTETENYCSFRDGENPSSVPQGGLYTEESPVQTSAEDFKDAAQEAMSRAWYWSSTQYSAYYAFIQGFSDGTQNDLLKDYDGRVRAVRRFIIN